MYKNRISRSRKCIRKVPGNIPNSEFEIIADYIVLAMDSLNIKSIEKFEKNEKGYIKVNKNNIKHHQKKSFWWW